MGRVGTVVITMIAVVQAIFFSALAPLLPSLEEQLGLTKSQAGLLVGVFPLGLAIVAVPVGLLTSRVGVRRFAVTGLFMLAGASAAFGLADDFGWLLATRLLQGVGSALCWSSGLAWIVGETSRHKRAAAIGLFTGAGAAGQVVGPAIGGLAVLLGRAAVFASVAAFAVLLGIIASRLAGPSRPEPLSLASIRRAHASRAMIGGLWLVMIPGLLMGTVFALAPLRLSDLGWGTAAISVTFLVTAAVGVVARPWVGKWADRRGLLHALAVFLAIAVLLTLTMPWFSSPWAFSVCIVLAMNTYGVMLGPAMAIASHAYETAQITQVFAFALIGIATGTGFFLGSSAGGAVAQRAGDTTTYVLGAAVCLASLVGIAIAVHTGRPRNLHVPGDA